MAAHPDVRGHYAAVAEAAELIAGPTHRNMGTVGGNLCLDTRCIFYNQSEWWRGANEHCLKTDRRHVPRGAQEPRRVLCHLQRRSRARLPAFGAEVDLVGPAGHRTLPLHELYIGHSRQDGSARRRQALPGAAARRVRRCACARRTTPGLRSAYDKIRIRRSIEYPVAGVAVALRREGDTLADLRVAITGTNPAPRPARRHGRALRRPARRARLQGLDELVRDQIMSMKTTFTPGHYRRRVAGVSGPPPFSCACSGPIPHRRAGAACAGARSGRLRSKPR